LELGEPPLRKAEAPCSAKAGKCSSAKRAHFPLFAEGYLIPRGYALQLDTTASAPAGSPLSLPPAGARAPLTPINTAKNQHYPLTILILKIFLQLKRLHKNYHIDSHFIPYYTYYCSLTLYQFNRLKSLIKRGGGTGPMTPSNRSYNV
jgi:hypothetical protein